MTLFHVSHVSRRLSFGTGFNQSLRFLGDDAQRNSDLAGGIAIGKECYRAHCKLAVIHFRGIPIWLLALHRPSYMHGWLRFWLSPRLQQSDGSTRPSRTRRAVSLNDVVEI